MVNIGVIGLGPIWDERYSPVLHKYRDRICVRAVYDPVAGRAEEVAAQWSASPVHGVMALLNRKDVRAVLLLDTAWHGLKTLEFACARKKPTYIAGRLGCDVERLRHICDVGRVEGLTLMPEMSRRHAPSTSRLHELMATQIGRPTHIEIDASRPHAANANGSAAEDEAEFLVGLIDWCRYVVRAPILQVEMAQTPTSGAAERPDVVMTLQFAPARSQASATIAVLRLREASTVPSATIGSRAEPAIRYEVECERGSAVILSTVEISWRTNAEPRAELLTSDRADVEVLIDHFCRRALGGLIPVPDIADVCRGLEVVHAARQSLASGKPVHLNGQA